MKLLMLRGLPASGKSTYAKSLIEKGGWVRVNNDDLRDTMHGGKWTKHNESLITQVREAMIRHALVNGDNVVIDNLNLHPKHKRLYKELAIKYGATFETKDFNTPVQECISRDLLREKGVGRKVIMDWYNQYLRQPAETYVPPAGKPKAIICDIDGTLAHRQEGEGARSFYDWKRVGEDTVDEIVADIIRHYYSRDVNDDDPEPKIILMSGRDAICRPETEEWLKKHDIPYDLLYMRNVDDNRKDSIVKRELFDAYIRENYQAIFILDDRNQVVEMWREMGLKVLQVAEGDF